MKRALILSCLIVSSCFFAAAAKNSDSKFIGGLLRFGENIDIRSEDTVDGPIVVFNGSVAVEGTVDGPVLAIGGSVSVSGSVDGPVVALGGSTDLKPGAQVTGPSIAIGGHNIAETGARVQGTAVELPWAHTAAKTLGLLITALAGLLGGLFLTYKLLTSLGWIALALAAWLLFADNLENSKNRLEAAPGLTALAGILFWPSLGTICLALLISILGIPFLPIIAAGVIIAWAWGFATLAYFFGRRLGGDRLHNQIYSVLAGAVLLRLLHWVPGIRWIVFFAVAVFGVGSALLSGFGIRHFPAEKPRR